MSQRLLIHGKVKTGKSTFASQWPNPLFLDTENGLKHIKTRKVPVRNWADFLQCIDLLEKTKLGQTTLVVDTVDVAHRYVEKYILRQRGLDYLGDAAHGKGWAMASNEWRNAIDRICALPVCVLFLAHSRERTVNERLTTTEPAIPERGYDILRQLADIIGYTELQAKAHDGRSVYVPVLRTRGTPRYIAGGRVVGLPDPIECTYAAFHEAYNSLPHVRDNLPKEM